MVLDLSLFLTLLFSFAFATPGEPPGKDPAMVPPPILTSPGPEYDGWQRKFQGIPGLERTRKGRLWATWYAGGDGEGPYNYVVLVTSGDGGRTWSGPKLVIDPHWYVRAYDPCLWIDPRGRLWLFWAQAVGHWDGRGGVWAITAENPDSESPRWSAPRRIANGVMMNKPTVVRGQWLLPIGGWKNRPPNLERYKVDWSPFTIDELKHDIGPEKGSNVFVSSDNGATFRFLGQAQVPDTQFDEHMIVERRDRSLWMLVRTTYGIGQSFSRDGGRSWTPGEKYMDHVVTRFFIRRLKSGRLLLVKHNPPGGKSRTHLTAYLSEDDGKSWQGGLLLDEREQVSYPDGAQAPDGTIYVIYDRERTRAREILMAVFTEDDVRKGRAHSTRARLRVLVNKAGE